MPIYRTNAINFNPIVEFDGANDYLYHATTLGSDLFDPSENTIFMMHRNKSGIVYFKWEHATNNSDRIGFERNGTKVRFDFPNSSVGSQMVGTVNFKTSGEIVTAHTSMNTSTLRMDGTVDVTNNTTGTMGVTLIKEFIIGDNPTNNPLPSEIDFAELIIYKRALSIAEMNQVESYMAIKYGVTLGINGPSLNYNSSGGNVIWNATLNAGYNFDIAGISRDDLTGQDQRKSKSINQLGGIDSDILTIANSTNFPNPLAVGSDMSHFIWGNNNAPKNMNDTTNFPTINAGILNTILDRHWKGQETGTVGTTTLQFDMANVTGFSTWSDLKLLVNTDSNFLAGATSISPSLIDSTGALIIEFEHDFSNTEGFYFTLATITPLSIDDPAVVITCDSFTLPPITGAALVNPQYYSDTSGTGSIIPVGTVITTDTIIYLYDETGGTPNQLDEDTLNITINFTQTSTDILTDCDSHTWINGFNYTASNNTATHTFVGGSISGCDSIVTLNLTIFNTVNSIDVQVTCGSFTWIDRITYTSSNNTATHTIVGGASNGCDSIVTLNLTISNAVNSIDVQVACGSFTWIDGIIYTSSNSSATHTITGGSINGCDSIITLNLTVFLVLPITLGEDQFICNEPVVLSPGDNFNSYLWSDNSNNSTFSATAPGVYSVTVTDINDCPISDNIELIDNCPSNFWAPNVFSPNGDNQNDIFYAVIKNLESYSMTIFNRWGISVFETNTIDVGWDGTNNGKKATEGTYFYVIEYSFYKQGVLTSEMVKGSVSLLK